ncbi:MAG: PcfJ domain-containing protein [Rhodocyclaceae bacterium]|nr:PcfJ domain-containing protein [Rhodocyclaceae bacterium]MBP6278193.1 PcfJ domain-containing protein [Rhodocyclaceae bacterium]
MITNADSAANDDCMVAVFGPLRLVKATPFITKGDDRIETYRMLGFDPHAIWVWVNHSDPVFRRNRGQLLDSFPILVPIFSHHLLKEALWVRDIEISIDRGNPLIETVARVAHVRPASVKFLAHQHPSDVGFEWMTSAMAVLRAVNILPECARPKSANEWTQMRAFWDLADQDGTTYGDLYLGPRMMPVFIRDYVFSQLCRNGYSKRAAARLNEMTGGNKNVIFNARDYFDFVSGWANCFSMREKYSFTVPKLSTSFLMRYSLSELIRQSEKWHVEIVKHVSENVERAEPNEKSPLSSWPPLLQDSLEANGLRAISLVCDNDLIVEGARLSHCVGMYANSCVAGTSHIISIRDEAGISLSTAEIVLEMSEQRYWQAKVIQHRGMMDEVPSPACTAMLEQVVEKIDSPAMQAWLIDIQATHTQRSAEISKLLAAAEDESMVIKDIIMQAVLPDYDEAIEWLCRERKARDLE